MDKNFQKQSIESKTLKKKPALLILNALAFCLATTWKNRLDVGHSIKMCSTEFKDSFWLAMHGALTAILALGKV